MRNILNYNNKITFSDKVLTFINAPSIVTDGLVMNLDAGNPLSYSGAGTVWSDLTMNNNNGTLVNGVGFSALNNGSLVFDSNSYAVINDATTLNITNSITLTVWINSHTLFKQQNWPPFICKGLNQAYMLYGNSNGGSIRFRIGDASTLNFLDGLSVINPSVWYNITATYDGTTMKIYTNSVLDNSRERIGTIPTTTRNVYIGYTPLEEALRYDGNLSNAMIYNRALSQSEILQNYNALKNRYFG